MGVGGGKKGSGLPQWSPRVRIIARNFLAPPPPPKTLLLLGMLKKMGEEDEEEISPPWTKST